MWSCSQRQTTSLRIRIILTIIIQSTIPNSFPNVPSVLYNGVIVTLNHSGDSWQPVMRTNGVVSLQAGCSLLILSLYFVSPFFFPCLVSEPIMYAAGLTLSFIYLFICLQPCASNHNFTLISSRR